MKDASLRVELVPINSNESRAFLDKVNNLNAKFVDTSSEYVEDLYRIDFPFIAPNSPEYVRGLEGYRDRYRSMKSEIWAYYPWKNVCVLLPNERDFFKLRTARNKMLITEEEQQIFYNTQIGIAGLSVGSSVLNSISLSGGAGKVKIADNDTLSITNLNRLFGSVCDLGSSKTEVSFRKTLELNPFADVEVFDQGLNIENLDEFFVGGSPIKVFIEEMDNIKLKIESRFKARSLKMPVIMATDNGDNTIIDVERFDLEPDRKLFHGKVDEEQLKNLPDNPSLIDKVRLANSIVGPDVTPRMQISLTMVGSKLPAWPQLGNAATLSGATISYVLRRIVTGQDMPSGRYEVNFDDLIDPNYHSPESVEARSKGKEGFIKGFELIFGE